ncbi:SGNH/GDSL hydrolase family protein [Spiroplasma alleghenense]|uniref:Lipolytic enzyme, GDSL family n=1 Tax=Spiroplasma alleghenense TaxID=216931 RepID=A0A345Z563_9MOLU|nr:SGNH/GDSL hydrolase family protein [Spiroplasma alleghenense]AXK51742.1 lipolytic enzyme, GDSL family [Spiroplasma alleghenense]
MKKLLQVLGSLSILVSSTAPIVSCTIPQKKNFSIDELIGKNIDTSNQKDDSNHEGMFTNYYTVGDSLSDTGALIGALNSKFNAGAKIEAPSYSNSFTNGDTAAKLLASKLGFENEEWGYAFNFMGQNHHGNNYAVGGATASNVDNASGMLLNNFKIYEQTVALIKQHKVKPTDLVFFEIGGNDLFQIINTPEKFQEQKIDEAMANIEKALLVLLNNGIRNIVVMNAPDVSKIPTYNTSDEKTIKNAANLSKEFNERFDLLFDKLDKKFPGALKLFDLYTEFDKMLDIFEEDIAGGNSKKACTVMKPDMSNISQGLSIKVNYESGCSAQEIDKYFFFDAVHPTQWGHEYVADKLFDLVKDFGGTKNA